MHTPRSAVEAAARNLVENLSKLKAPPTVRLLSRLEANDGGAQADVLRLRWELPSVPSDSVRFEPLQRWAQRLSRDWCRDSVECGSLVLTREQAVYLFAHLLAETVSWYGRFGAALRTPELRPLLTPSSSSEWERAFSFVSTTRARLLTQGGNTVDETSCGQLAIYYPDAGSAGASTNGFLDRAGSPPWDSWVFLGSDPTEADPAYRTYLAFWVPAGCILEVDQVVESCPRLSVQWATDADTPLTRALREASLLG